MATAGEIVWASVTASSKVIPSLFSHSESVWLEFSFGPWVHYRTPVVSVRDFKMPDLRLSVPTKIKPKIRLCFARKVRMGLTSEQEWFRVTWDHSWSNDSDQFFCTFLGNSKSIFVRIFKRAERYQRGRPVFYKFRLYGSKPKRYSRGPNDPKIPLTPLRLFNLSLRASVLSSVVKAPKIMKPSRGPWVVSTNLRPSPEERSELFIVGGESNSAPYSQSTISRVVYRRTWTGSRTPGFGSKKRIQLPVNPHTVDITKTDYAYGFDMRSNRPSNGVFSHSWGPEYYWAQDFIGPLLESDVSFTRASNKALKRLNSAANLGVQANLALAIAEGRKTTSMIANTATKLAATILLLKKGQVSAAVQKLTAGRPPVNNQMKRGKPSTSKSLAENWLELQYGWKPLLSDIEGSMKSLANSMVNSPATREIRASAYERDHAVIPLRTPDNSQSKRIGDLSVLHFVNVRYGIRYKISSNLVSFLSQTGFTNPINLVWELIPYSFVVDWFIPIGSYLESMSAPEGITFVSGYKTSFGRRVQEIRIGYDGPLQPPGLYNWLNASAKRSREQILLRRVKLSSYPTMQFPAFQNPFQTTRALNALALLRSAHRSR